MNIFLKKSNNNYNITPNAKQTYSTERISASKKIKRL